jgi:septation ring formation regulator EzrA
MTVKQGRQMNETFSNNEKTIKGVKDSLKYYIQSDKTNSETVDTLWAKYTEMKYKFETNLKVYLEYDKKYQKDVRNYRTDQAVLSAAVIILSCMVLFVPGLNFRH